MIRIPLLVPFLTCATFLAAGALSRQGAAPSLCGAHDSPPEKGLPAAEDLFAGAAAALAPERTPWLETDVWQQVQGEEGRFVARGRLLCAPGRRQRMELTVRVGKTEGELLLVSDGRTAYRAMRVAQGGPMVSLRTLSPSESSPGVAAAQNSLPTDLASGGPEQVVAGIRERLTAPRVRRASWKGQAVYRIQGTWRADPPRQGDLLPGLRPPATPRTCAVLLDARTLWPHRIEWAGDGERDIWQIEFRDPVLNQPLPAARCARLFAVPAADN
jgi:hypothetical protein